MIPPPGTCSHTLCTNLYSCRASRDSWFTGIGGTSTGTVVGVSGDVSIADESVSSVVVHWWLWFVVALAGVSA